MFAVSFTENALEDLRPYPKSDQVRLIDITVEQLSADPATPTRRKKELRPNDLSRWELRIGDYRVFYDVNETTQHVSVKSVGVKQHNKLLIRGQEHKL